MSITEDVNFPPLPPYQKTRIYRDFNLIVRIYLNPTRVPCSYHVYEGISWPLVVEKQMNTVQIGFKAFNLNADNETTLLTLAYYKWGLGTRLIGGYAVEQNCDQHLVLQTSSLLKTSHGTNDTYSGAMTVRFKTPAIHIKKKSLSPVR